MEVAQRDLRKLCALYLSRPLRKASRKQAPGLWRSRQAVRGVDRAISRELAAAQRGH